MSGACSMHGRDEKCIQNFGQRPRHRWENIGLDLRERGWGGVDWIHLAQDREEWWALLNVVMNVWVP